MNLHAVSEKNYSLVTCNDPKNLDGDNLSLEISELIFGVLVAQSTGKTNPKELMATKMSRVIVGKRLPAKSRNSPHLGI
jgi:hypothetical protein